MKISSRTQYGLRLMLNLALGYGKGPFLLREIAKRENISEKYLSQIIIPLKANGLVASFRGAKGGYILAKSPSKVSLKDIVEILEGELSLVEYNRKNPDIYTKTSLRITQELWNKLSVDIAEFLTSVTLEDLVKEYQNKDNKALMYNI